MTKLELYRREQNKTQQELANEIECSVSCYNMYENNQRKVPNEKAEKIAKVLGKEKSDIFLSANFTVCEVSSN